jgi:Family of unknown function (DUF5709)
MTDQRRPESADLTDYQTLDSYDTLDGAPGDDPLDRGVAPPERWSAGMRTGTTADELEAGESLDQLLAEEEPDPALGADEDWPDDDSPHDDDPSDPRAGRLVAHDGGHHVRRQAQLLAHDVGPDGGGASAEEAAVHVIDDIDTEADLPDVSSLSVFRRGWQWTVPRLTCSPESELSGLAVPRGCGSPG